jgi:hypothetical protein
MEGEVSGWQRFKVSKDPWNIETFETLKLFFAISEEPSPERRPSIEDCSTRAFFKR